MKLSSLKVLHDKVLVTEMEFGERISLGGIIQIDDDSKFEGVRPRWARVCATGPKQNKIQVGDYVLLHHARWTRAIPVEDDQGQKINVHMIDYPTGVLMISKDRPVELDNIRKG